MKLSLAVSFASFALVAPLVASAAVLPRQGNCNTGSLQCCNSVQSSTSTTVAQLAGLLGIDLGSITGLVGLTCSPLSILAPNNQSAALEIASYVLQRSSGFNVIKTYKQGGLISLGCNPINLNL
ncbi:hypothetical protein AX16_001311 [Volvariella volvacea WC 439]|nr:hypothetical protein AX16_001311 [Volvariella volvacea WC 439]